MMDEFDDQKSTQSVDEYWAMVLRRKWWILGPLFFGWLLVFASTWVIPAKYASESVVLIQPPKVPSTLVATPTAVPPPVVTATSGGRPPGSGPASTAVGGRSGRRVSWRRGPPGATA